MAEHGIIYTGWEVRRTLEGAKTQTRRIIKPQPRIFAKPRWQYGDGHSGVGWYCCEDEYAEEGSLFYRCPYAVGDVLWVKETWWPIGGFTVRPNRRKGTVGIEVRYRADNVVLWRRGPIEFYKTYQNPCHWMSPIYMRRWASRLNRTLTGIRAERVQDITPEDVIREGLIQTTRFGAPAFGAPDWIMDDYVNVATVAYRMVWDSMHAHLKPAKRNPYTSKPEKCKVAYPWDDVQEEITIDRKASPYHGCKMYTVGNPSVWVYDF